MAHCTLLALLVFAVMLGLTLPRTSVDIQVGDGADFAAAALSGGLAHPPGFPVFTQLMAGQTYAGIATANAFLQATSAALLCGVVTFLSGDAWVAAGAAVAWALYPATLQGATDTDVFALHHLFSLAVMIASVVAANRSSSITTATLGVMCGLAGATHPIALLWAPWVLWALWHARRIGLFSVTLVLGLTPYLLLWARYRAAPALAFADITTWTEWAHYVLRRGYGTFQFSAHQGRWQSAALPLLQDASKFAPGLLLGGLFCGMQPFRAIGRADGRVVAAAGTIFTHLGLLTLLRAPAEGNHDVAARFMPSFLLAAACGAALVVRSWPRRARWLCTLALALAPAALSAPAAIDSADARHDFRAAFIVDEALREAPPRAVYLAATDTSIFGATLRRVQGVRPDVDIIAVPRLAGGTYRTHLAERIPQLAAVPLEERLELAKLATALHGAGRPIIADPIATPPPFVRTPLGVVFAWGTEQITPSERERLRQGVCHRLPPELGNVPVARLQTQWMWNISFDRAMQAQCKR